MEVLINSRPSRSENPAVLGNRSIEAIISIAVLKLYDVTMLKSCFLTILSALKKKTFKNKTLNSSSATPF